MLIYKKIDLTGQKFGDLMVVKMLPREVLLGKKYRIALCKCTCGNEKAIRVNRLTGTTCRIRHCGCKTKEAREKTRELWKKQSELYEAHKKEKNDSLHYAWGWEKTPRPRKGRRGER